MWSFLCQSGSSGAVFVDVDRITTHLQHLNMLKILTSIKRIPMNLATCSLVSQRTNLTTWLLYSLFGGTMSIPATIRWKLGYTLNQSPDYHRTTQTQTLPALPSQLREQSTVKGWEQNINLGLLRYWIMVKLDCSLILHIIFLCKSIQTASCRHGSTTNQTLHSLHLSVEILQAWSCMLYMGYWCFFIFFCSMLAEQIYIYNELCFSHSIWINAVWIKEYRL